MSEVTDIPSLIRKYCVIKRQASNWPLSRSHSCISGVFCNMRDADLWRNFYPLRHSFDQFWWEWPICVCTRVCTCTRAYHAPPPPPTPSPSLFSAGAHAQQLAPSVCEYNSAAIRLKNRVRVPGEIKRSSDLRGGRWSWTLTFAQKRSWVGRWSWAEQVGRLLLRVVQVVRQQRCNGHCLSGSVQHSSWKSNCAVHKSLGNGEGTPP